VQTFIFVDILLIIQNPFFPRERRKIKYIMVFFLVLIAYFIIYFILLDLYGWEWLSEGKYNFYINMGIEGLFIIIQIVVLVRSLIKLSLNGTSDTLLKRVKRQYLMFLLICIIMFISDVIYAFNVSKDHYKYNYILGLVDLICNACFFLVMITEPFVWFKVCEVKDIFL